MRGRSGMLSRSPSPLEDDDQEEGDADLSLHIVNESQHRKLDGCAVDGPPGFEYKSSAYSRKWVDLYAAASELKHHRGRRSNQRETGRTVLQGSDSSSQSADSSGGRKKGAKVITRMESSPEEGELHDEPQRPTSRETPDDLRPSKEDKSAEKKKKNNKAHRRKKKKTGTAKEVLIDFQEQEGKIGTGVQPGPPEPEHPEPTKEKESVITSVLQSPTTGEVVGGSVVMWKLLRGRRYFDPPDEEGEACNNCGKVGHPESDCPEERQRKPCYVCGDLEHEGWTCPQKVQCYACGKPGHRARSCPNRRSREVEVCMRCGDCDHGTARCRRDYSADDLQHVKCYVCKNVGHLSCRSVLAEQPTEVSCYGCGELGHSGDNCLVTEEAKLNQARSRGGSHVRAEDDVRCSPWDSRRKQGSRSRDSPWKDDEISGSPAGRSRGMDDQVDGRRGRHLQDLAVSRGSPGGRTDGRLGRTHSSSRYDDDSRASKKQRHNGQSSRHHQSQDGKSQESEIADHGDK